MLRWEQQILAQGGRGITSCPLVVLGNGNHWRFPTPTLGHYYPKTEENEAKSGVRCIGRAKSWKPAVAEIIVGCFVGLTVTVLQSSQPGLQAVTTPPNKNQSRKWLDLVWGEAGRSCLTTHAKYLAKKNKQVSGWASKQWINLWDFNDGF